MAFCHQCGASLVEGARYCSGCAAATSTSASSSVPTFGSVDPPKSDIGANTLMNPDSAVFKAASNLKPGQTVEFSGDFPTDQFSGGCFMESSLTLDGKIEEPDFIFRFSEVAPASPMR
jgi:hypothetical protein